MSVRTRSVRSWNDLEQFGIVPLTGEACGLNMRILCDVTTEGKAYLERFFGGNMQIRAGSNWNGGSKGNPHVGSVLLPYSILTDLGAFLLVFTGHETAVASVNTDGGGVLEFDGKLDDKEEQRYGVVRYYRRSNQPGTGDRNQHAMSGRIE